MSSFPVLPLWVNKFDGATAHLTLAEDGAYNRLLRLCWKTEGCSVPDDEAWLCRKLRVSVVEFQTIILPVIDEFFSRKKGRIFQERLTEEFREVLRKSELGKIAGKRSGLSRRMKVKANSAEPNANQTTNQTPTKTEHARQAKARASQGEVSHRLEVSAGSSSPLSLAAVNGQLVDMDEEPFG